MEEVTAISEQDAVEEEEEEAIEEDTSNLRKGTMTSAKFNILSSMVGGGSLSLPLAFYQLGNAFVAPLVLITVAILVQYSITFLLQAACSRNSSTQRDVVGSLQYESVASSISPIMRTASRVIICTICFFTVAGYGVLLRDMLIPINDEYLQLNDHPNASMLIVILLITPLCTLSNLTSFQYIGILSMMAILLLFGCISYRSIECNVFDKGNWYDYLHFVPPSTSSVKEMIHQIANGIPIFITVFMCHFNVLPVHNELINANVQMKKVVQTSIRYATVFYLCMGFVGSMYGNCIASQVVDGNVLLSFDDDDPLLLVGRCCLSITIAFALPVFVVPARDMLFRGYHDFYSTSEVQPEDITANDLTEPLLLAEEEDVETNGINQQQDTNQVTSTTGTTTRVIVSIAILWAAAALSCCVESIDTVWDILGSSFQVIIGFIIPSLSFLRKKKTQQEQETEEEQEEDTTTNETTDSFHNCMAWTLLVIFIPIMIICTGNSIYNIIV